MPRFFPRLSDNEAYFFTTESQYLDLCLKIADDFVSKHRSMEAISRNEDQINRYANLEYLEPPRDIRILQEEMTLSIRKIRAVKSVLEGRVFTEHAVAGEATRLGLGPKYRINVKKDLSLKFLSERMSAFVGKEVSEKEIVEKSGGGPEELLPLSLGERHMLQLSFDIYNLAMEFHANPRTALENQKMLIVLNEQSADMIIEEISQNRFFGFSRENMLFMIQKAYPGIHFKNNRAYYDLSSPIRLHNHGYIALQQTMQDQIFYLDESENRCVLKPHEYGDLLGEMDVKIHLSIESLSLLKEAIDLEVMGFSLEEGERGKRMLMEIVRNDPENPQKGGMAAFDAKLGKNVMIEAFQLMDVPSEQMRFLNRNLNYYPKPFEAWSAVKSVGLNMPICVKDGYLYFQPVQGDINFLLNTGFFQRKTVQPIEAWKSIANTPLVIRTMREQDQQDGFKEYAESILGKELSL